MPAPAAVPTSKDAVVSQDADGQITLHPYPGQTRRADYPGGKGTPEDVARLKGMLRPMGTAGEAAVQAYDQNYNNRADELSLPDSVNCRAR